VKRGTERVRQGHSARELIEISRIEAGALRHCPTLQGGRGAGRNVKKGRRDRIRGPSQREKKMGRDQRPSA